MELGKNKVHIIKLYGRKNSAQLVYKFGGNKWKKRKDLELIKL